MTRPTLRIATRNDLLAIVALLADDERSAGRELPDRPLIPAYLTAWEEMAADPRQLPLVAEEGGRVVGYLQLSLIPGLAYRGLKRALVESVRVASDRRGNGIGEALIGYATDHARNNGARLVQLTSSNDRADAHRFYEGLGFEATHTGFKLRLDDDGARIPPFLSPKPDAERD